MLTPPPLDPGALYQVLAESAPDPILVIDEASTIVGVNPAAERVFGYSAAEMIGTSLHLLMPPRMRAGHDRGLARYLATGTRHISWHAVRVPIQTKGGAEIPVEISFGEIRAGGRRLFAGFLRDVSDRVAYEEALADANMRLQEQTVELEQQMEQAHLIATELERANADLRDAAARAAAAQRAAEESDERSQRAAMRLAFLGEASRALGASLEVAATLQALVRLVVPELADYCHLDLLDESTGVIRRVATAHVDPIVQRRMEELARQHPPTARSGYATVRAIATGEPRLVSDITAAEIPRLAQGEGHRRMLEALRPRSFVVAPLVARGRVIGAIILVATDDSGRQYGPDDAVLLDELARRAAVAVDNARLYEDSEHARAAAIDASRAKDAFMATMSHELRTPLNAIAGYVELMEMGLHGPLTDQQREDLTRIRRSERHLLALVNDVLDLARLESGTLDLRPGDVPLADVLADLDALVRPQIAAKGLTYVPCTPRTPLAVRADRDRLLQVLLNLVSNSVKFTGPGGGITLACDTNGPTVELRVVDTGIGIPPDQLERIFQPFTQVHEGLTRRAEGTGLGLAISRDLARGMGGDLRAESAPGEGTTLVLTLPAAGV